MRFRLPGAALLAVAAFAVLAAPAQADNYPIRDGTGASQTFCSKLVSGLQYPCHLLFGSNGGTPTPLSVDGSGNAGVNVQSSALPTGAATAANQSTANTSLGSIDTKLSSQATATNQATANTSLSTIATNTTGVATAANQATANTSLSSLDTKLPAKGAAAKAASTPVTMATDQYQASSTDSSSTVATGGTFQTVFASNSSRKGCLIQNPGTATEIIQIKVGTMATAFTVPPGGSFSCNSAALVVTDAITLTAATTGHAYAAISQ